MKKNDFQPKYDDDNLVDFLKTHSLPSPSEIKPCEELVMRSVHLIKIKENQSRLQFYLQKCVWLLPLTLMSAVIFMPNYFSKMKFSSQRVSETEELEAFMVDVWHYSLPEEESVYMVGSH